MKTIDQPEADASNPSPEGCDWLEVHGDFLFHFALGQVRDPTVAEDLVQETFLAALKAKDRFAGHSTPRTWLVGILRHKICDHLRHTCRERAVRADIPAARCEGDLDDALLWLHEIAAECDSPSRHIELAEFRDHLERALGKLPERIAQVFQLHAVEERPNRELCETLRISENNLWVMLHRARKQLRTHLAGVMGWDERRQAAPPANA